MHSCVSHDFVSTTSNISVITALASRWAVVSKGQGLFGHHE